LESTEVSGELASNHNDQRFFINIAALDFTNCIPCNVIVDTSQSAIPYVVWPPIYKIDPGVNLAAFKKRYKNAESAMLGYPGQHNPKSIAVPPFTNIKPWANRRQTLFP
jgi:hypothetical protein